MDKVQPVSSVISERTSDLGRKRTFLKSPLRPTLGVDLQVELLNTLVPCRGQGLLKVIAIAITAVASSRLLLCRTGTAQAYTIIICLFSC